jgi:hypothetical protein
MNGQMNERMWQLDGEEIRILAKFTYDCLFVCLFVCLCGNPLLLNKEGRRKQDKEQAWRMQCKVLR